MFNLSRISRYSAGDEGAKILALLISLVAMTSWSSNMHFIQKSSWTAL